MARGQRRQPGVGRAGNTPYVRFGLRAIFPADYWCRWTTPIPPTIHESLFTVDAYAVLCVFRPSADSGRDLLAGTTGSDARADRALSRSLGRRDSARLDGALRSRARRKLSGGQRRPGRNRRPTVGSKRESAGPLSGCGQMDEWQSRLDAGLGRRVCAAAGRRHEVDSAAPGAGAGSRDARRHAAAACCLPGR